MNELFEKEGQSIFTFKRGDIIIRLKPAITQEMVFNINLGISTEVTTGISNSFREPIEFVAIENNKIYLRWLNRTLQGKICKVDLETYSDDWALFVVPDGLTMEDCL